MSITKGIQNTSMASDPSFTRKTMKTNQFTHQFQEIFKDKEIEETNQFYEDDVDTKYLQKVLQDKCSLENEKLEAMKSYLQQKQSGGLYYEITEDEQFTKPLQVKIIKTSIGCGGFGHIYPVKVSNLSEKQEFVIKLFDSTKHKQSTYLFEFLKEMNNYIKILNRCNQIVWVYGVGYK